MAKKPTNEMNCRGPRHLIRLKIMAASVTTLLTGLMTTVRHLPQGSRGMHLIRTEASPSEDHHPLVEEHLRPLGRRLAALEVVIHTRGTTPTFT